ncbi:MAG: HD domain-containing protein [Clostridia bacterium]|nr:HD domain-containing protein [Clostridia bacterium]
MEKYNNVLIFYKEFIKIEQIMRKGWIISNVPAERLESVGDHTLQLIMLASVITKEFGISFDNKKLIDMLLMHDIGEIVIGDISDTEVDVHDKKSKEAAAVKSLLSNLSAENAEYYYALWAELKARDTEMAKFAYMLDKIDAVIKSRIYEDEYNVDGLFDEFVTFQRTKGTFDNGVLEDFFSYLTNE